jgi:hypothetical protein
LTFHCSPSYGYQGDLLSPTLYRRRRSSEVWTRRARPTQSLLWTRTPVLVQLHVINLQPLNGFKSREHLNQEFLPVVNYISKFMSVN